MKIIDFRSDTVTKPSKEMKEFMFSVDVGDDVFGEDPTVNKLEVFTAQMFGKEAGLFCSSGTQTNQIAINVYCRPGDEVICSSDAHIYKYEGGGIAKNSGASVRLINGNQGRLYAEDIERAFNDPENVHYPISSLVALEDTMNRGGGAIYDFEEIKKIKQVCIDNNVPLHLDGARVFNALTENNVSPLIYGEQFDSISICLSKGLGAPVGSVLVGTEDFIKKARRVRKVVGGGMRQAGIIAAAGLFALQNNVNGLKNDHANAKLLAKALNDSILVKDVITPQTNIVIAELKTEVSVDDFLKKLKSFGVLAMPFDGQRIRFVTHLDITADDVLFACKIIREIDNL